MQTLGRNERCHCGSGVKYKKCCLDKDSKSRAVTDLLAYAGEDVSMVAFHHLFPEVAEEEGRSFWALGRRSFEDPAFFMLEFYCPRIECDCRRVVIGIHDEDAPSLGTILSVGYAFDRDDSDPGPYIDPTNPLTDLGRDLYPLVSHVLESDKAFVARLERHYQMVKARYAQSCSTLH